MAASMFRLTLCSSVGLTRPARAHSLMLRHAESRPSAASVALALAPPLVALELAPTLGRVGMALNLMRLTKVARRGGFFGVRWWL